MPAFDKERLKAARRKLFKTQDEFAEALGFSKIKVARFESGMQLPDLEDLEKIADTLCVSRSFLIGEDMEGSSETKEAQERQRALIIEKAQDFSSFYGATEHIRTYGKYISPSDLDLLIGMVSNIKDRLVEMRGRAGTSQ